LASMKGGKRGKPNPRSSNGFGHTDTRGGRDNKHHTNREVERSSSEDRCPTLAHRKYARLLSSSMRSVVSLGK